MDYAEIFLERADLLKYQLYTLLARPYVQDITITDLANMMHSKYQPAYNIFQELLDDLVSLVDMPREQVRTALLAAQRLPLSLDAYRAHLAQNGLMFRLVDYVLNAPSPSPNQFCEQEFVSRSTISRKLKPLNAVLGGYGVKLKLARFAFSGPEYNIRHFLYTLYWWAYRGVSWPFATVEQAPLEAECAAASIVADRPLTHLQQLYFLAVSHLRVGKKARLHADASLQAFDAAIVAHGLRHGGVQPPLTRLDIAAFNFFQLSQPRFDIVTREPQAAAVGIDLLTNDTTAAVIDGVAGAVYQPDAGDLDDDLYLNLLRLSFGYSLIGAPFPQAQDYLDGDQHPVLPVLAQRIQAVLEALPNTAAFVGFHTHAAHFAETVAHLAQPYLQRRDRNHRLQVQLVADPLTEGYQTLNGFINSVPWVAASTDAACDMVIGNSEPLRGKQPDFSWYADALSLDTYRESLITTLVHRQHAKVAGVE